MDIPGAVPVTGEVLFTTIHVDAPVRDGAHLESRGRLVAQHRADAPYSSYIHDFMITNDHAVVVVSPITMSQERVLRGGGLMAWEPDRAHTLPSCLAADGTIVWIEADRNFYDLHPQNVFVDDGRVRARRARIPDRSRTDGRCRPVEQFRGLESHLVRYRFDPVQRTMTSAPLDDRNVELPQCDLRRQGLSYRYGYNLCNDDELDDYNFNAVLRYDLAAERNDGPSLRRPRQPVRAPLHPSLADAAEGDGYLVRLRLSP